VSRTDRRGDLRIVDEPQHAAMGAVGEVEPAMFAVTPTPGARTLIPLPWKTSGPLDLSPGMAYSFRQLAWNAIVTVGPSPVGERLQALRRSGSQSASRELDTRIAWTDDDGPHEELLKDARPT